MKKVLCGSAVAFLFIGSAAALAADLPAKAPVKAPGLTAVDWSGWYFGGHLGYGGSNFRGTYDDAGDNGPMDFRPGGFVGGGQLGYLWQTGRTVNGFEIDGTWSDLSKNIVDNEDNPRKYKTDALASARYVSGIAIDDKLLFSSIGLAYAHSSFEVLGESNPPDAKLNWNSFGLASGFGLEWVLAPNWSARAEYLYYGFNKRKNIPDFTGDSEPTDFVKLDDVQVIRVAVNYRPGAKLTTKSMSAPAVNWAGGYIGGHVGYGRSQIVGVYNEYSDNGSWDIDPKGVIGGGQIGWNWQSGAWVYGVELDGTWSGMDDSRTTDVPDTEKLKTNVLASGRLRAGFAANDVLFYVTGGVGYASSSLRVNDPGAAPTSAKADLTSWAPVVGSGLEWAFAPNWSARVEGLTYMFDHKKDLSDLTSNSFDADYMRQTTVNVVRAGLNYRY